VENISFPFPANRAVLPKRLGLYLSLVVPGAYCSLALFRVFESLRGTAEELELFLSFRQDLGVVEVVSRAWLQVLGIRGILGTIMLSNLFLASSTIIFWFLSSIARILTCCLNFSRMTLEVNIPGC